jgi:hypothetical protein
MHETQAASGLVLETMGVVQSFHGLEQDAKLKGAWQCRFDGFSATQDAAECLAFQILHDYDRQAAKLLHPKNPNDIRVIDLLHQARFRCQHARELRFVE